MVVVALGDPNSPVTCCACAAIAINNRTTANTAPLDALRRICCLAFMLSYLSSNLGEVSLVKRRKSVHPILVQRYIPTVKNFDSIIVGYYEHDDLIYVARVRNGFIPALRAKVFERFHKLESKTCPFSNLPQRDKGRWGQGLTADKMGECRWLKPHLVACNVE